MQPNTTARVNQLGIYTDPQSGKSLEALESATADAFLKLGWVYDEEKNAQREAELNGTAENQPEEASTESQPETSADGEQPANEAGNDKATKNKKE